MAMQIVRKSKVPPTKAFDELVPGDVFRLNEVELLKLDGDLFVVLNGMYAVTTVVEENEYCFVFVNALMREGNRKLEVALIGGLDIPNVKKSTRVVIIPSQLHLYSGFAGEVE